VDDNGLFDSTFEELKGLDALSLGNKLIMKKLEKNIVCSSKIMHNYPYDWRTKQPVIIKASKQWFINTERLKTPALVSNFNFIKL
jgi:isoleucyl-tRNA synthetase